MTDDPRVEELLESGGNPEDVCRACPELLRQVRAGWQRLSGAPVVDEEGRCIGVLSTTDFLHFAEKGKALAHAHAGENTVCAWQIFEETKDDSQEIVEDYMNCDPVTVTPETSIGDISRIMIDAHIHRVIVVDERDQPIGIVSSTDILGAVAQADSQYSPPLLPIVQ